MAGNLDKTVLSFYDSLLKESDFNTLNEGCWLNDKIIGFAFEYFERIEYKDFIDKVSFISPDVTQLIKLASQEEASLCVDSLELGSKQVIMMAVNDHSSAYTAGGSHWSLLLYSRLQNNFLHYDSMGTSNRNAACITAKKVEPYLKVPSQVTFMEAQSSQQINGCDCGMYVIANAEQIAHNCFREDPQSLNDVITPGYISAKRSQLKQLILSLAQQGYT